MNSPLRAVRWAWSCLMLFALAAPGGAEDDPPAESLRVAVSWGHRSPAGTRFQLAFRVEGEGVRLERFRFPHLEPGASAQPAGAVRSMAGGGVVDEAEFDLRFPARTVAPITNVHSIWRHLLDRGDPETAARLRADAAYRPDPRRLTVVLGGEGTRGFSLTVDQLRAQRAFWVPELDVFVSAGEPRVSFEQHRADLAARRDRRVRDRVAAAPEASSAEYAARWEDMGHPAYRSPHQTGPGQLVGVTWDSALPKFGIDRAGGVWNDYGTPGRFRLFFDFADLTTLDPKRWRGQRLTDGLPVVRTAIERDGLRWELEQFAYPLDGPPEGRRGDIPMVLLTKATVVNLGDESRSVSFALTHERPMTNALEVLTRGTATTLERAGDGGVLLAIEGAGLRVRDVVSVGPGTNRLELGCELGAGGAREFLVRLPSPVVPAAARDTMLALDFAEARRQTLAYWQGWVGKGAVWEVPDRVVNDLFRANLWHALRLPRRHGGSGDEVAIDLPYSNFAYDQLGTPWPVNQAVYVDAMLYDQRGYHAVAAEELAVMFRRNQEPDGRVGGFANWGVYTPSMVYAVARNFRLSGDRAAFARLLPSAWRALEWCARQIGTGTVNAEGAEGAGLMRAPLNDLSHEPRAWAFNQAYLYAAFDELGHALAEIGDPRATECRRLAAAIASAVEREFGRAAVRSPLVPLRDGTWIPFVPGDALTPGRQFAVWYPTDVDTGPLHLARLGALDPRGFLATALLHDHEDNLFWNGWGMANEPVYQPHATVWLTRDEVPMVVRTFYSMLACGFSHSTLEPVEHRWGWGQYFGPPSTDGAWFDQYRNMLVREPDDTSLWLCQATPRAWWQAGRRIRVERAPTVFGPVSFTVTSEADRGEIRAVVETPRRRVPAEVRMRFRHPEDRMPRSVTVNGKPGELVDLGSGPGGGAKGVWVRIPTGVEGPSEVVVRY